MKCCIVRDLLPGYIDGLTSEETNEEIRIHLENCSACNTVYRQMSEEIPIEAQAAEKEIDFLKKLKERMHRKYALVALSTCAILIGAALFLKKYEIPVSYDPDCMTAELFEAAYIPNRYGLREWQYLDRRTGSQKTEDASEAGRDEGIDTGKTAAGPDTDEGTDTGKTAAEPDTGKTMDPGEYRTMERLCFVLNLSAEQQKTFKINHFISNGRTIRRNGKDVRVIYYCYTWTLWNSLFPDQNSFMGAQISEGEIYEEYFSRNANAEYQPLEREVYYLPMGNMDRLDNLTDEAFDAQRAQAQLVWSGVI